MRSQLQRRCLSADSCCWLRCISVIHYPRESERICFHRRQFVCLFVYVCVSVCDHDNQKACGRICTKCYAKVPRGTGKTKFVFRYDRQGDVEVTVKKLRKPAIVYKIAPSGNSELAGRKIVGVARVAKCGRQKCFRGDLYSLRVLSIQLHYTEVCEICRLRAMCSCRKL